MRCIVINFAVVVLACNVLSQEPKRPAPAKEHEWLKQLVGEWDTESEMVMEPGKPPLRCKGVESSRMLGGFWYLAELRGEMMGATMVGHLTVGFDPGSKKYVGTWICNGDSQMWKYNGSVNGKSLTLDTEGANPVTGKIAKMRDVIELKSPDHKVLTSSILGDDGKWTTFMTLNAKRKK